MVEVKVGERNRNHVARIDADRGQSVGEAETRVGVEIVETVVTEANAGIDHDGAVGVPDHPPVDWEWSKRGVLGMAGRHAIDHGEGQPPYPGGA
jgi:hypothetical protein